MNNKYFYELPEESHYVSLAIAGLSFVFLIFVLPVWIIQVLNCVKSPGRRKCESEQGPGGYSKSFGELSDTGSMLLKASSEWEPTSFNNQNEASFLALPQRGREDGCCYYGRRNDESMGLSLGKK